MSGVKIQVTLLTDLTVTVLDLVLASFDFLNLTNFRFFRFYFFVGDEFSNEKV